MGALAWSPEEVDYLESNWGSVSVKSIAKNLNRSVYGVLNKVFHQGLGPFLECGDYITTNQLYKALGRVNAGSYTMDHWISDQHMPVKYKKRLNSSIRVIYLNDFWKWAAEYRMRINFAKVEVNALGKEPDWVAEQLHGQLKRMLY